MFHSSKHDRNRRLNLSDFFQDVVIKIQNKSKAKQSAALKNGDKVEMDIDNPQINKAKKKAFKQKKKIQKKKGGY